MTYQSGIDAKSGWDATILNSIKPKREKSVKNKLKPEADVGVSFYKK